MRSAAIVALAASLSTASAQVYYGFNYGATQTDGSIKVQSDFQSEFQTAKNLVGTNGVFTSARLYTNIQGGTANTPTSAFPAAIAENTKLLLGIWASGGDDVVTQEIAAIKSAISQYGTSFTNLCAGISVGSEDLYRNSPIGIEALAGIGANPDTIVSYINQVKSAIAGTPLANCPVGHVDTWTAWVNGSNNAVIEASSWLGVDAYPYFQNTMANGIDVGLSLFQQAYQNTVGVSSGKSVWITETGWPVSGKTSNLAIPSLANAKTYWDEVGCQFAFGKINTFWYTLQDAAPTTPNPSFGIVGSTLSTTPLFDLSCSNITSSSTSAAASSTSAGSSSGTAASASASSSATSVLLAASATGGLTPSGAGNGVGAAGSSSGSAPASSTAGSSSVAGSSSKASSSAAVTTAPSSGGASSGTSSNSTIKASNSATQSTFTGAAAAATGHIVGGALAAIAVIAAAL